MKDSIVFFVVISLVLLLLLFGCSIIAVLFLVEEDDGLIISDTPVSPEPEPPADIPLDTSNVSSEDMARWERITLDSVEDGCLRVAKDEAGSSASLVYGCTCDETLGSGRKTYSCDISTADPFTRYFANIDCLLVDSACSIETNYGVTTQTFQEMDEWYG